MNQYIRLLQRERIFKPNHPIFVSRVVESFYLSMHTHDFVEIVYCAEGTGFHHIEDEVLPVKRGDLFLLPVGVRHVFRPASADKDRLLVVYNCVFPYELIEELSGLVSFDPQFLKIFQPVDQTPKLWSYFQDENGELYELLERLYTEYSVKESGYIDMLKGLFIQLLITLQRHLLLTGPRENQHRPGKFHELIRYVEDHCNEHISLAELAERSELSVSHFQRHFKKISGQTFLNFLQNCRIQRCCRMLLKTDHSIEFIANSIGYQDMKFFNKLFKKKTGVTPRQYRNTGRETNPHESPKSEVNL